MNNIRDMWDNIKGHNTCVTEVQEGKRGKMELKKISKNREFLPYLAKYLNLQTHEAQRILGRKNTEKTTPTDMVVDNGQ